MKKLNNHMHLTLNSIKNVGYSNQYFRVLRMNCLLIRPRWMWEERDVIGNMPLNSLMIPGTHNSGSYIRKGSNVGFLIAISLKFEIHTYI